MADLKSLVTIEQLKERIPVSLSTLQKLTATGEISSIRIGRARLYDPVQVQEQMENRLRKGPELK